MTTAKPFDNVRQLALYQVQNKPQTLARFLETEEGKEVIRLHATEAIATYVSLLPTGRAVSAATVITMGDFFTQHPLLRQLTAEELKTFFQFAFKQQKYGKLYAGFGYDTLLEWLTMFFDERCETIADINVQTHNQYTAGEKTRRNRSEGDALAKSLNHYLPKTDEEKGSIEPTNDSAQTD